MASCKQLLFLSSYILIIINLVGLTIAQPDIVYEFCINNGNYISNSTYQRNLNTLLSSLSSNIDKYGFYSSSVGQNPDRVNAIVLCRGDVDLQTCPSCINDLITKIIQVCPNYKEASGGYDNCMLRYSDKSIYGTVTDNRSHCVPNPYYATYISQFKQDLRALLDKLRNQATSSSGFRKFAVGNITGPNLQNIFGLVQCTPDLSKQECSDCLLGAAGDIRNCSDGKIGGRIFRQSCNLQYETHSFFNTIPGDAPPQTSPEAPPPASPGAPPPPLPSLPTPTTGPGSA
ncbi:unnamed protein product [Camellia sinensis]